MHIRQYRPSDKQALRRVCAVTAPAYSTDARRDALYAAYLDYYIDCEPEYCFVAATDADEAVGYVICAPDFKRYRESYFSKRLPYSAKLLKSAPDVWLSKRAEAMIVKKIASRYPAHLHIQTARKTLLGRNPGGIFGVRRFQRKRRRFLQKIRLRGS